ncbi:MAG: tRNA preQ1(34) S-adenosylmethionine ribosyltransferase-isomerase QueA, partial [Patescibacteria group bacterium]
KYLDPADLLVFNQSKVFPARLSGHKETGGKVGILLLTLPAEDGTCKFIGKNIRRVKRVLFGGGLVGEIVGDGLIKFNTDNRTLLRLINKIGQVPLPPYIDPSRSKLGAKQTRSRYQTVYARELGSAAAPTAGFHFTSELLEKLPNKTFVTLHVGLGTFLPVKTTNILDHHMHAEHYEISQNSKSQILNSKSIVAVGTTSVRTLESWANTGQSEGETDIFITPGYEFKIVEKMITNFHQPKSSLLMLVSAFAGRALIMKAYAEAVKEKYRFFSFGDAMLIV